MTRQSQDTFIVGKSKFPQCSEPGCFYAPMPDSVLCKAHCSHDADIGKVGVIEDTGEKVFECPLCKRISLEWHGWSKLPKRTHKTIKAGEHG